MIHGVYEARDGYVAVRAIGEKALSILAETIGVEADELKPSSGNLVKWFRERTRAEILGLLAEKIPCASVLNDEELVEDPNVVEREMIVEKHHPLGFTYRAVSTGIKFSETPVSIDELPPELGEDTVDVLHLLGYDDREIANMLDEEIIIGAGA
jgi:crotonobetainyl-CoA:carnitine CoA-transferase CaiB-like acyl-CoA transferase